MRLFPSNERSSSARTSMNPTRPSRSTNKSMSWSLLSTLVILSVLLLTSFTPSAQVSAVATGFCGDCQTFANAIAPCGTTFGTADIEINGTYVPPQSAAKCICSDVMQKVLWTCAKCELLAGWGSHSQPPQAYQTQCIAWGISNADWKAAYTGVVAPGTSTPLTGTTTTGTTTAGVVTVPGTAVTSTVGANPSGTTSGSVVGTGLAAPGNSSDASVSGGTTTSSGPNGTAIGISVGIIGVAVVAGAIAAFMMKRNRRRHEPLDLDGTYVGLDDQWEKPGRPQSPPMMPAPIASGAPIASRGPMQSGHRPSPFESRPGGGSVAGGYDGQYDQYDHKYANHQGGGGGYDGYNHGGYQGYDQSYDQGYDQGYPAHDYGYEHTVPTSGPYHGGNVGNVGGEGGQYM